MAPYRNRLVVIEAAQFHVYDTPWPDGVERATLQHNLPRDRDYWPSGTPIVHTAAGALPVREGDWIITRTNGERYICQDATFQALWEPYDPPRILTVN